MYMCNYVWSSQYNCMISVLLGIVYIYICFFHVSMYDIPIVVLNFISRTTFLSILTTLNTRLIPSNNAGCFLCFSEGAGNVHM